MYTFRSRSDPKLLLREFYTKELTLVNSKMTVVVQHNMLGRHGTSSRLNLHTLALEMASMGAEQDISIIGDAREDGLPVVFSFKDELPSQETRENFRWLTVISWKYDRDLRNGMPPEAMNKQMIALEHAIDQLEEAALCRHAYSRTGNGLKELVYYIPDREQFMGAFNQVLSTHPPYPIEINFYEDVEWMDFHRVRSLFKQD